jgi:hypothetical protein
LKLAKNGVDGLKDKTVRKTLQPREAGSPFSLRGDINAASLTRAQKLTEAVGLLLENRAIEGNGRAKRVGGAAFE